MADQRVEFRFFTVPQWRQEEEYLRRRHQEGWKLNRVTGIGCYHFTACTPEDVVYQLDYPLEQRGDEYLQIFRDCGWEYVQTFWGYTYFRKPVSEMNGPEEIFGDEESRLAMMKRVAKRRLLPLVIIFFLIILPQIFLQSLFDRPENRVVLAVYEILFVLYLALFAGCGYSFWKFWKRR